MYHYGAYSQRDSLAILVQGERRSGWLHRDTRVETIHLKRTTAALAGRDVLRIELMEENLSG
jgi:hypothetical protein